MKILKRAGPAGSHDRTGRARAGKDMPDGERGLHAKSYEVTLIPGDGIGPEVAAAAVRVLSATGIEFEWHTVMAGAERHRRRDGNRRRPPSSESDPAHEDRAQGARRRRPSAPATVP